MFAVFYEEKVISVLMFLFLVFSITGRIMIGVLYQHMIHDTENMSATKNKMLRQCKLKFANCYQLNGGVANIPIFVDKCLNRMQIGPFTFQTVYHLSGQMMLLSVFFAGAGVCRCIIRGFSVGEILPFYIVSFLGLYLYFAVSAIADIKGRRRILKTNLVDYLENHMVNRLACAEETEAEIAGGADFSDRRKRGRTADGKAQSGTRQRTGIELMPVHAERREETEAAAPKGRVFSVSEERELEELLKEFLTS